MAELIVIGGGLAGSEAAWQAASRGMQVKLFEMRPTQSTGAHATASLAELVCSNSLGSNLPDRASGLLKEELRQLGSLLLDCAEKTALPAGGALAVDREGFSNLVTERLTQHPRIEIIRQEVNEVPGSPSVIASGPLTSSALTRSIQKLTGQENLYFFDALAPVVTLDSINMEIAYRASRYGAGEQDEGDYINCPFEKEDYTRFVRELLAAERIHLREFEDQIERGVQAGAHRFFEGCLPIEILAARQERALAFGPLRPVGLRNPLTGKSCYAVLQLRQDNLANTLYNLVGFQTNLTFPEQKRVFRLIPGLENAEFVRYGQMHRNTFIASPRLLMPTLQFIQRPNLFFAGQITGVEGYMGNIATGLLAGWNAARLLQDQTPVEFPPTTMLGALCHYITHASLVDFQPMKANYGILPPLPDPNRGKKQRALQHRQRSLEDISTLLQEVST